MARMGPMPKHPDRLVGHGPSSRLVPVGNVLEPPAPGRGWLKVTKDSWVAFWESPIAGAVSEKDMSALVRLFDMRNRHERMGRMVDKNPFLDGSQGQPVLNPAARLMVQLMSEIRQMEREFGLTPDSGARVVSATAHASKSVEELVASGNDDLQIIDVAAADTGT